MKDRNRRLAPVVCALFGVMTLLVVTVTLVTTPPASGYEPSVYGAFPLYFWVMLILTLFFGAATIVASAWNTHHERTRGGSSHVRGWTAKKGGARWWIFGVALMVLANAVVVLMPEIRGYPIYGRADTLTHVGYVKNIVLAGSIDGNIYPNTHIVIWTLSSSTGIDPQGITNWLFPVFAVVYFGGLCLLITTFFENRSAVLVGLAVVLFPIAGTAHVTMVPFVLSIFYVPFFLYFFLTERREPSISVRVALVISLVALIMYHPLTALFLLVTFGIYRVLKRLWTANDVHARPTYVASLAFVVFSAWYTQFAGIILRFQSVLETIVGNEPGENQLDTYTDTISRTSPEAQDLAQVIVFNYGSEVVVSMLVGLCTLALVVLWWRKRTDVSPFAILFVVVFWAFTFGSLPFLTMDLIVGWGRLVIFAQVFGIVLVAALCSLLLRRDTNWSKSSIPVGSVIVIVLLLSVVSVGTVFHTPAGSEMSHQTTQMEIDGSEWFFENREKTREISEFGVTQYRFHDFHYGVTNRSGDVRTAGSTPPPRFNYTERSTFGGSYEEDRYLLLTERGRILYPVNFPNYEPFWNFRPADFDRIETDPTVLKMYDNGEFTAYRVDGIAESTDPDTEQQQNTLEKTL